MTGFANIQYALEKPMCSQLSLLHESQMER